MPQSSVRVLPDVSTAASMSEAALAMRRSSWRISATRSTARLRSVLTAGSRGRIWRRMSAARSAVSPRGAPAVEVGEQHLQAIDGLGAGS
jgi:hypothetical protein